MVTALTEQLIKEIHMGHPDPNFILIVRSRIYAEHILNFALLWLCPQFENPQGMPFSRKIEELSKCGWLRGHYKKNVELIRKIGNEYVHSLDIDDKKIKELINEMNMTPILSMNEKATHWNRYESVVINTLMELHNSIEQKRKLVLYKGD